MFQAMRRQDRMLSQAETEEILVNGVYGVLSINGDNDYAYGIPLSYVYLGSSIYFHCALEGEKLTRIGCNNKVAFCVVGEADLLPEQFSVRYKSAVIFGAASVVGEQEKTPVLMAFIEKYSRSFIEKGKEYVSTSAHRTAVVKITIEQLTGKARK